MASEAVAMAALHSDSVFVVECGIIRRLAMLLVSWGSLSAEKKACWREHWIVCAGLLWKPWAGCKTGEVELPDKNSGASWNEVIHSPMRNTGRKVGVRDGLPQGDICMSGSWRSWKLQRRTAQRVWRRALRCHAQDRRYGSSP